MNSLRRFSSALLIALLLAEHMPFASTVQADDWGSLEILGHTIEPGSRKKFGFASSDTFQGSYLNMPVLVARGSGPGPTLCRTAGIHGDEINGVEIARRAFAGVSANDLRGTLIALPSINAEGVRTGRRYLSDRRDLNRAFPGSEGGSVASLIAHAVFTRVLKYCDALVDLHTASNQRANLPQIRDDLSIDAIREMAIHFGIGIVVGGAGPDGSLRKAAADAGIVAIIYEAGEPLRFQESEIESGVDGIENVMAYLDMIEGREIETPAARIYGRSRWIRANPDHAGFFFPDARLGDDVAQGDAIGRIVDPLTDEVFLVTAPISGELVGMAWPQPVLMGYALFHLAWKDDSQ